jgi:hypothetical protein
MLLQKNGKLTDKMKKTQGLMFLVMLSAVLIVPMARAAEPLLISES